MLRRLSSDAKQFENPEYYQCTPTHTNDYHWQLTSLEASLRSPCRLLQSKALVAVINEHEALVSLRRLTHVKCAVDEQNHISFLFDEEVKSVLTPGSFLRDRHRGWRKWIPMNLACMDALTCTRATPLYLLLSTRLGTTCNKSGSSNEMNSTASTKHEGHCVSQPDEDAVLPPPPDYVEVLARDD